MISHQSLILSITGGIACGKTEVGNILADAGFDVLDTDRVAHEAMKKSGAIYDEVVERFGSGILAESGEMDRGKLGAIIFNDSAAREALNALVHPPVLETVEQWRQGLREARRDGAALIPLLFEVDAAEGWDAVICVSAPESTVLERLSVRGLSTAEAKKRIAAQMPLAEKEMLADFVILNNGALDELRKQTSGLLAQIRKQRTNDE